MPSTHLLRRKSSTATSLFERSPSSLSLGRRQPEEVHDIRGRLGLNVLYAPSEPLIDFIFVHGLRGGSRKTWSKTEDINHYWPQRWLPLEPRFKNVRIHSFGYNSDWGERKSSILTVHDFGQALLGEILNSPELSKHEENTAIVLVGHSMGGIVIKKALLLARQDPHCQKLVGRFHSMFFLATPHRGADSAQLLSKLLSITSNKAYVGDLVPGSMSIQLINDEFRNAYQSVQLWSFYETITTSMGLIVDKESAVIGLPGERVQLMNADHRNICKFDTRQDSNYCSLRNAFLASIESIERTWLPEQRTEYHTQMQILSRYLGVEERPESELSRVNQRQTQGSCKWLTDLRSFQEWIGRPDSPRYFWLDGEPATGKSTIAGHVVRFIEETNGDCAFFFFKHGDSTKSSAAALLRSLAWQMARVNSDVRQELIGMAKQGHYLDKLDEASIWRNIFTARILRLEWRRPCYWIIDALDECSDLHALFPLLSNVEKQHPLRIFVTSRPLLAVDRLFTQEKLDRIAEIISIKNSLDDIQLYLQANAAFLPAENEVERDQLLTRILKQSNGNFLWTYLILQDLADTLSMQQAYEVLDTVPDGMDGLYSHILEALTKNPRKRDITTAILRWSICSIRPLKIEELKEALRLDINVKLPRLESSLGSIMGNLLYVDTNNMAQLAHQTLRSFLTRDHTDSLTTNDFTIIRPREHYRLSHVCLAYLRSSELKATRNRRGTTNARMAKRSAFAAYAVQHFSDHIAKSQSDDVTMLNEIHSFLCTNSLTWIEIVATSRDLTPIAQAAKNLKVYLRFTRSQAPIGQKSQDIIAWSADLSRLVASFGKLLIMNPGAIYFLLPPVCPSKSIIHRSFATYTRPLQVLGLSEDEWDDRIACIVNPGRQAFSVTCEGILFAVGYSDETTRVYDTSTMQERHVFPHGDEVRFVVLSSTDQNLAAASRKKISLWNCTTTAMIWEVKLNEPLLALSFSEDNKLLMGATRSNEMFFWDSLTGNLVNSFQFSDIDESTGKEHRHAQQPSLAVFSPGLNLLAVVYRQRPIVVWYLEDCSCVGQYSKDTSAYLEPLCFAIVFNAKADIQLVAAAYDDGEIVTFDPWTDCKYASANAYAVAMQGSKDGTILVSGDSNGRITLYKFESLEVLYKIDSYELSIRNFAFSNDGLRFFDVRGDGCNIWEPPVLVRRAEMDDELSMGPSEDASSSVPPTVQTKTYDHDRVITAMAAPYNFDVIFCGREDGSVAAYSALTGELLQEMACHTRNIAVIFLYLSHSGKLLVSADRSRRIVARGLNLQGSQVTESVFVLDKIAVNMIVQITISMDDKRLLVSMSDTDELWEIETTDKLRETIRPNNPRYRHWIQNTDVTMPLLHVSAGEARFYGWNLIEASNAGSPMDLCLAKAATSFITSVTSTINASHLCILLQGARSRLLPPTLRVWNLQKMRSMHADPIPNHQSDNRGATSIKVPATATYDQIANDIKLIIGIYGDSLVFLTHLGWVYSLKLTSSEEETHYTRHFFIPFRYHNNEGSLIIHVSSKGNILIAYRTAVIIFAGGLDFEEKISWKGDTIVSRPSMRSTFGSGS